MHPSRAIRSRSSRLLEGRTIILGVSGSIAAVEVPKIARELIRHGADVHAVMSGESTRLVSPEAIEFATGHPPILQLSGKVEHVAWLGPGEGQADLLLVAPATANTISKIAHGIDDTPVTSFASVALGGGVPVLLAPAMHAHMGANPAVRENLERLRAWGVGVVQSVAAEGEEKIASPDEVAAAVLHALPQPGWKGRRVVVIGGASRESIDAVRSITNESSGASAVALSVQAYFRGAEVDLWAGAVQVPVPGYVRMTRWRGVRDLAALARRRHADLARASAVLVPAALSDYTLVPRVGKIRSRSEPAPTLALQPAPKVLPSIRKLAPPPCLLVAFKLLAGESGRRLEQEGRRLQQETGADWVVANDVRSMGTPDTEALVLPAGGDPHWIRASKPGFAGELLDEIGRVWARPPPSHKRPPRRADGRGR